MFCSAEPCIANYSITVPLRIYYIQRTNVANYQLTMLAVLANFVIACIALTETIKNKKRIVYTAHGNILAYKVRNFQ